MGRSVFAQFECLPFDAVPKSKEARKLLERLTEDQVALCLCWKWDRTTVAQVKDCMEWFKGVTATTRPPYVVVPTTTIHGVGVWYWEWGRMAFPLDPAGCYHRPGNFSQMGWRRKWGSPANALKYADLSPADRQRVKTLNEEFKAAKAKREADHEAEWDVMRERAWMSRMRQQPQMGRTLEEVKAEYRRQAMKCHPDRGGSTEAMVELNLWYGKAMERLGA